MLIRQRPPIAEYIDGCQHMLQVKGSPSMSTIAERYRCLDFDVPPITEAVPNARRQLIAVLSDWAVPLSPEALDDVELMSSEVITNAVVHTAQACRVSVHWTGTRLRVEVADASAELPEAAGAGVEATSGRGLFLVDVLATAWGTESMETGGKRTWFEVSSSAVASDSRPAALARAAQPPEPGEPLPSLTTA